MPGHPIPLVSIEQAKEDVGRIEKLFDEHDVIFLLMDSRESRWLPTVLGAAKGKVQHKDQTPSLVLNLHVDSYQCCPWVRYIPCHASWCSSVYIDGKSTGLLLLQ
jgi:hypothetical protein